MPQKPKSSRRLPAGFPQILREPFYLNDYASEQARLAALRSRLSALYRYFRVDPTDKDADRLLLEALIVAFVPGFRSRVRRAKQQKSKAGRPVFREDRVQLVAKIDRWRDSRRKQEPKTVHHACRALTGPNQPYQRYKPQVLANQYYKHNKAVRRSPKYFGSYPESFCELKLTNPCFTLEQFDDTDWIDLRSLCKGSKNCRFCSAAAEHVAAIAQPDSLAALIEQLVISAKKRGNDLKKFNKMRADVLHLRRGPQGRRGK